MKPYIHIHIHTEAAEEEATRPLTHSLTERTRNDLVSIRVIEGNGVHHIPMSLQSEQLVSSDGVPDLAGAVVTARDELVARLVEGAIGEGEDMCTEDLEQKEVGCFVAFQLFN